MSAFKPIRTTSSNLSNVSVVNGQFVVATDTGAIYVDTDSGRVQLGGSGGGGSNTSSEVTISDTSITQALANNTIYTCSNPVTSLTVTAASGFSYAVMNLTTGSSGMTFSFPSSGWVCTGSDCTSGVWYPLASVRYSLAFEKIDSSLIIVYVYQIGSAAYGGLSISYNDLADKPTYLTSLMTSSNSGKYLTIDSSGNLVATDLPVYTGTVE